MDRIKPFNTEITLPKSKRLLSLDALRGFDMFWIVSGEGIFHGLANAVKEKHNLIRNPNDWTIGKTENLSALEKLMVGISNQLHHSPWNGFTFYDLIFPLFIFISGVSMPFSYQKYLDGKSSGKSSAKCIYLALFKRTIILILLGLIVNGLFKWNGYENTRFASVLGRIALATFFAALIYLNFSLTKQVIWFFSILIGYYLLLSYVPIPHFGAGNLSKEGNLCSYLDRLFLPGKLHRIIYDPEGLLGTLPAICSAMTGVFTGTFLHRSSATRKPLKTVFILTTAGLILILLGLLWNCIFPINKTLWTSSFVLLTGGCSILLFVLFYSLIDIWNFKGWSLPFIWIGSNSILIYVCAHGLVNFESTAQFIFGGIITKISLPWQQAALWTGVLIIQLILLKLLYDKKLFVKI